MNLYGVEGGIQQPNANISNLYKFCTNVLKYHRYCHMLCGNELLLRCERDYASLHTYGKISILRSLYTLH